MSAEAGTNWVANDIPARLGEMLLGFDEGQLVATFEEMSPPIVTTVERLCVKAVQPLQSARERRIGDANDQVIVVRHKAIRETLPGFSLDDTREQRQEPRSIVIVTEETTNSASRYVVTTGGSVLAKGTRAPAKRTKHYVTHSQGFS
jgi:hypothetical protein